MVGNDTLLVRANYTFIHPSNTLSYKSSDYEWLNITLKWMMWPFYIQEV
jgi:hypothetical protein